MTEKQEELFKANIDIIEWLAYQLSDSSTAPEMLMPLVERYLKEAVEKYDGPESEFEDFAVKYITLRVSKYKLSDGESFAWSEDKMEHVLAMDEEKSKDTEY